jgi:hypothetical protein
MLLNFFNRTVLSEEILKNSGDNYTVLSNGIVTFKISVNKLIEMCRTPGIFIQTIIHFSLFFLIQFDIFPNLSWETFLKPLKSVLKNRSIFLFIVHFANDFIS